MTIRPMIGALGTLGLCVLANSIFAQSAPVLTADNGAQAKIAVLTIADGAVTFTTIEGYTLSLPADRVTSLTIDLIPALEAAAEHKDLKGRLEKAERAVALRDETIERIMREGANETTQKLVIDQLSRQNIALRNELELMRNRAPSGPSTDEILAGQIRLLRQLQAQGATASGPMHTKTYTDSRGVEHSTRHSREIDNLDHQYELWKEREDPEGDIKREFLRQRNN